MESVALQGRAFVFFGGCMRGGLRGGYCHRNQVITPPFFPFRASPHNNYWKSRLIPQTCVGLTWLTKGWKGRE